MKRRHPAQVAADRLLTAADRWRDKLDDSDRGDFARVVVVLEEIAEGRR